MAEPLEIFTTCIDLEHAVCSRACLHVKATLRHVPYPAFPNPAAARGSHDTFQEPPPVGKQFPRAMVAQLQC